MSTSTFVDGKLQVHETRREELFCLQDTGTRPPTHTVLVDSLSASVQNEYHLDLSHAPVRMAHTVASRLILESVRGRPFDRKWYCS